MTLLAELDDAAKYTVLPEAEVFDEHERRGKDGKVKKTYTKADLERYVAGTNARDAEGKPCAMTVGHTVDDQYDDSGRLIYKAREEDQPKVVGCWRKFRLAFSPEKKRHVIKATPYVKAALVDYARSFPHPSIEVWDSRSVIDPVAILRRTPDRPAPPWTFGAEGERYKPDAASGERYRYAMDLMDDPSDPTKPPSASAPDQQELERWMLCATHWAPKLKQMLDIAEQAEAETEPGAAPGAEPDQDQPGAPNMADTPKPDQYQMPKEVADKFSAMEADAKKSRETIEAQSATIANMQAKERARERRTELEKFAAVIDDMDAELKDCEPLTPEQFAAHLKRLERVSKHAIDADPALRGTLDTGGGANGKAAPAFTRAHAEKAEQFMRDNHDRLLKLSDSQRWERAQKFALTGKEE